MLALLICVWISGRAMLWENPFSLNAFELPSAEMFFADTTGVNEALARRAAQTGEAKATFADARTSLNFSPHNSADSTPDNLWSNAAYSMVDTQTAQRTASFGTRPMVAAGHNFLMAGAFRVNWSGSAAGVSDDWQVGRAANGRPADRAFNPTGVSPVTPAISAHNRTVNRWSLDTFAFYRQGSGSTSISQGRVPVYGASQVGANLQYRAAPGSRYDPRAFLRAYRAFVPDGENEIAAGVSARPIGALPVRIAAELRVTDNSFGTEMRPAAYAVTELPPVHLPFDLQMEAYGGAGYVGGSADTGFVDGQAAVTREVISFDGTNADRVRLSVGGGAWGGAQKDASRLDIGPTMRMDLTIGDAPARISVDWRERVAGDAAPNSGIAATLSTRF